MTNQTKPDPIARWIETRCGCGNGCSECDDGIRTPKARPDELNDADIVDALGCTAKAAARRSRHLVDAATLRFFERLAAEADGYRVSEGDMNATVLVLRFCRAAARHTRGPSHIAKLASSTWTTAALLAVEALRRARRRAERERVAALAPCEREAAECAA